MPDTTRDSASPVPDTTCDSAPVVPGTICDSASLVPGTTCDSASPVPGTTCDSASPVPGTTCDSASLVPGTTCDSAPVVPGTICDRSLWVPGTDDDLNANGWAMLRGALTHHECDAIAGLYDRTDQFRSTVVMARHGFGRGEYKYFSYPLPPLIAALRASLYPQLSAIANRWNESMNIATRFPADHASFIERCHRAGQTRPTPLILKYGEGDYNALHQDLYGDEVFPLQVAFLLSAPDEDFTGGEFVLTEQRPRMQTRAEVVPIRKGDAVIFAVHHRPHQGSKGYYRVNMRHGVSRVRSGRRFTMGVIFHDAR